MSLTTALTAIAVIPIGPWITIGGIRTPLQIADVNIGLLIILGITSVGVYGVALAGWSSNSKYSMLGSLRASAQMVSYEIALGLSLVGVLILSRAASACATSWTRSREPGWASFPSGTSLRGSSSPSSFTSWRPMPKPTAFPSILPEAETELVAGYHTEYSSMKFAMFFMAEYANMFTVACLASVLFFGGWSGPVFGPPILQVAAAGVLVRGAGVCFYFHLHLGPRHVAAFSL